jgi:hypothetical protein
MWNGGHGIWYFDPYMKSATDGVRRFVFLVDFVVACFVDWTLTIVMKSMTITRLNDITLWSIYPRVRCLNGESVISMWFFFSLFFFLLFDFDFICLFSVFVFLWRILILVLTSMFAASVQRDGRHPPDEAFGLGQHQQPVDVEQWRRKQLVQRPRTGWSTAPPQDRHCGISQRTSSPLARKQQPQLEEKFVKSERPDQTIL